MVSFRLRLHAFTLRLHRWSETVCVGKHACMFPWGLAVMYCQKKVSCGICVWGVCLFWENTLFCGVVCYATAIAGMFQHALRGHCQCHHSDSPGRSQAMVPAWSWCPLVHGQCQELHGREGASCFATWLNMVFNAKVVVYTSFWGLFIPWRECGGFFWFAHFSVQCIGIPYQSRFCASVSIC